MEKSKKTVRTFGSWTNNTPITSYFMWETQVVARDVWNAVDTSLTPVENDLHQCPHSSSGYSGEYASANSNYQYRCSMIFPINHHKFHHRLTTQLLFDALRGTLSPDHFDMDITSWGLCNNCRSVFLVISCVKFANGTHQSQIVFVGFEEVMGGSSLNIKCYDIQTFNNEKNLPTILLQNYVNFIFSHLVDSHRQKEGLQLLAEVLLQRHLLQGLHLTKLGLQLPEGFLRRQPLGPSVPPQQQQAFRQEALPQGVQLAFFEQNGGVFSAWMCFQQKKKW